MGLSPEQRQQLKRRLRNRAPSISVKREGWSSRFEGEWDTTEESVKGYASVVVYIERGLGGYADDVLEVLQAVQDVQRGFDVDYPACLFAFGFDDTMLTHSKQAHRGTPARRWTKELCHLAGTDVPSRPVLIPSLFPFTLYPTASTKSGVTDEDLLVFFCRDRNVVMRARAKGQFRKNIARDAVWVFFDGPEPEIIFGGFVPDDAEVSSPAEAAETGRQSGAAEIHEARSGQERIPVATSTQREGEGRFLGVFSAEELTPIFDIKVEVDRVHSTWMHDEDYHIVIHGDGKVEYANDLMKLVSGPLHRVAPGRVGELVAYIEKGRLLSIPSQTFVRPGSWVMDAEGPTMVCIRTNGSTHQWTSGQTGFWGNHTAAFQSLVGLVDEIRREASA